MNHPQIEQRLRAVADMRADDGPSLARAAADCIARLAAREIELTQATNSNFLIAHKQGELIKELAEAARELASIVKIHSKATDNNFAWAELQNMEEALAKAGGQS